MPSETTTPSAETTTPSAETTKPAAETTMTSTETAKPAAETTMTSTETAKPSAEVATPSAETTTVIPEAFVSQMTLARGGEGEGEEEVEESLVMMSPAVVERDGAGARPGKVRRQIEDDLASLTSGGESYVFLGARQYFIAEGGFADVDVMRLGQLDKRVGLRWWTEDGTANAGADYVPAQGEVWFKEGSSRGRLRVQATDDEDWSPECFFHVRIELLEECDGEGIRLGLKRAKVSMVEDDLFPHDCPPGTGAMSQMLRYFFVERLIRRGPKGRTVTLIYMYRAFYLLVINTLLTVFVVQWSKDIGARVEAGEQAGMGRWYTDEKLHNIWFCVASYAVLTVLFMYFDFMQLDQRGRSGTRQDLRTWLVGRFLDLPEDTLRGEEYNPGRIVNLVNNDVEEVTNKGWYSYYILVESVTGIILAQFLNVYLAGYWGLLAFLAVPPSVIVTHAYQKRNMTLLRARLDSEERWQFNLFEIISQAHVIQDYDRVEAERTMFSSVYGDFYHKHRAHRKFQMEQMWYVRWILNVGYYLLLCLGPVLVGLGTFPLANFVGYIKAYSKQATYVIKLNEAIGNMQRASPTLGRVSDLLNTETSAMRHLNRQARMSGDDSTWSAFLLDSFSSEKGIEGIPAASDASGVVDEEKGLEPPWAAHRKASVSGRHEQIQVGREKYVESLLAHSDVLLRSITFDHVDYLEPRPGHKHGNIMLFKDAHFQLRMGSFVSVCGKTLVGGSAEGHGFGKGIFCGLLAGTTDPSEGRVITPPHAHVAQVTSSFFEILDRSVWENLTFGMQHPDSLTMEVLQHVGSIVSIGSTLLTKSGLENRCGPRGSRISTKNRMAILIARAILSDPDILLFNGAEVCYTSNQQARLYQGLKDWVLNGGVPGLRVSSKVGSMPRLRMVVFACISDLSIPAVTDHVVVVGAGESRVGVLTGTADAYMKSVASVLGSKCVALGAAKPAWTKGGGENSASHVLVLPKVMPEDCPDYAVAFRDVGAAMVKASPPPK